MSERSRWVDTGFGPGYTADEPSPSGIEALLDRALLIHPRPEVPVEEPRRVSPECMVDAHDLCPGKVYEWPRNAAYATVPTHTWVCGCPTPECDCTQQDES